MLRVGIVANEPSGDVLGASLIREIRARVPDAVFEGIGGPNMIAEGCRTLFPMEKLTVMGLVEVLKHLPELLKIRKTLLNHFLADPPDIFIGVDAPDFNLGLETKLKQAGIKTVHYVSPTVWAWRPKRVEKIKRAVDLLLAIFPFEEAFLKEHGVPVAYVGHPIADEIPVGADPDEARERLGLDSQYLYVALLPGSRMSEVETLSEPFLKAAKIIKQRFPDCRFLVPLINSRVREAFSRAVDSTQADLPLHLFDGQARDVMLASDAVLTASGTATLEGMLLKRPMVVSYRLNALTYWIVTTFNMLKIEYVAMANLLAGEEIAPELIQHDATPEALANAMIGILESPQRIAYIQETCARLHKTLKQNSGARAAQAVLELVDPKYGD
jgi:lipid-A-disaccharide synthase